MDLAWGGMGGSWRRNCHILFVTHVVHHFKTFYLLANSINCPPFPCSLCLIEVRAVLNIPDHWSSFIVHTRKQLNLRIFLLFSRYFISSPLLWASLQCFMVLHSSLRLFNTNIYEVHTYACVCLPFTYKGYIMI